MLKSRLLRLPTPLLTPLPMLVTFLVGLVIWTIAFSIPVPYPQETMAPYPDATSIATGPGHSQARSAATAAARSARPVQRAAHQLENNVQHQS